MIKKVNQEDTTNQLDAINRRLMELEKKEMEDFVAIYTRIDDLEAKVKRLELDMASIHPA